MIRDERRDERRDFFFEKVSREHPNPPDELVQNVSKNPFLDELFLFSFESSESYRVFNYLHDSNSIFRAAGINSEWYSGGTVNATSQRPEK